MASSPEDETAPVPTISQRLQRTLHCINLTVPQVRAQSVCGRLYVWVSVQTNILVFSFITVYIC